MCHTLCMKVVTAEGMVTEMVTVFASKMGERTLILTAVKVVI